MATLPVKKTTFQLYRKDRREMMFRLLYIVHDKLLEHKKTGINFNKIAETINVPKTRISEAYHKRYVGEDTLRRLVRHGYISADELLSAKLSDTQVSVLMELLQKIDDGPCQHASSKRQSTEQLECR